MHDLIKKVLNFLLYYRLEKKIYLLVPSSFVINPPPLEYAALPALITMFTFV